MAFDDYRKGEIGYEQYVAILDQVERTSSNMNEKQLEEQTTASFLEYLDNNDLLDKYLEDHQPFVEYVVDKMPSMVWKHGEGYIPVFIKNAGESEKKLADYLMKQEKEIIKATKIADLDAYRDIKKKYANAEKLSKTSKYLGRAGKAFGWAGVSYGLYSDIKHDDKTVEEAVAHSGSLLAIGGAIALASNPGGWAIALGVGATAAFEFQNTFGLQDWLDKAGQKLDEWGEAAIGMVNPAIHFMNT